MREFDALRKYPAPKQRRDFEERTFRNKLIAAERGEEFFDGERANGYGGLVDDGRWRLVAEDMKQVYDLGEGSKVLQIYAEKGFLLAEFERLGIAAFGTDPSDYARQNAKVSIAKDLGTIERGTFDLVIALGPVYMDKIRDAIYVLKMIQFATKRNAFVTLAAWDEPKDFWAFRQWSLLGTTILRREEWRELMEFAGYTGDYKFVTAKTLGLL